MGDFFKYHLLPLVTAVLLAAVIWSASPLGEEIQVAADMKHVRKALPADDFYPNLIQYPSAWQQMRATLLDTQGLLIMGSSELTGDDSSGVIPYRWLNKYSPFHVLAIGHAGNQAFSMLTQLASLDAALPGSRVVIILSPVWYQGTNAAGTSSELFLQYTDRKILQAILDNPQLDQRVKNHLYRYIRKQYAHIVSPSPELKCMRYQGSGLVSMPENLMYYPLRAYNRFVIWMDQRLRSPEEKGNTSPDTALVRNHAKLPEPDVDSLMQRALEQHALISSGNAWGIEDSYYQEHIRGQHGHIKSLPHQFNQELNDLEVMAAYMEYRKVNALFIMQGVNPFYYNHLADFKPVDQRISAILQQHGHAFVNMIEYDSTRYVKGMLKDIMHYGAYGWLQLNREITKHYQSHE